MTFLFYKNHSSFIPPSSTSSWSFSFLCPYSRFRIRIPLRFPGKQRVSRPASCTLCPQQQHKGGTQEMLNKHVLNMNKWKTESGHFFGLHVIWNNKVLQPRMWFLKMLISTRNYNMNIFRAQFFSLKLLWFSAVLTSLFNYWTPLLLPVNFCPAILSLSFTIVFNLKSPLGISSFFTSSLFFLFQ